MLPFEMRTYNGSQEPAANRIFILMKGNNAGKPSRKPFRNSLALTFTDEQAADRGYNAILSLYYAQTFRRELIGSVIPFIRVSEIKMIFKVYVHLFELETIHHRQLSAALEARDHMKKQTATLQKLIHVIAHQLII